MDGVWVEGVVVVLEGGLVGFVEFDWVSPINKPITRIALVIMRSICKYTETVN